MWSTVKLSIYNLLRILNMGYKHSRFGLPNFRGSVLFLSSLYTESACSNLLCRLEQTGLKLGLTVSITRAFGDHNF
jgi:hypothetical protein